ncbi:MAG TPA: ATP synthase F1 subunit gamma [Candidatus Dormibacteraeota bacterium]|nr:ATP synthase F1 subunit gamma [Candidatus Dormibacteraeota bacterium]
MPTLLDYRRRIRSVKSTQQITRAMKFVAAAKLRRAQEGVFAARPYAHEIVRVLRSAAARIELTVHPLLERRPEERILVVVLTGDRSLCGAFNANVLRRAFVFARENSSKQIEGVAIGKKGRDTLRKRGWKLADEYLGVSSKVEYSKAKEISAKIAELYAKHDVDAVYAVYNEFKNVLVQRLRVEKLLPIDPAVLGSQAEEIVEESKQEQSLPRELAPSGQGLLVDYIYEEPVHEIFDHLVPRYLESEVFRILLESAAAEHAARMTAMDSATRNASELIDRLTLEMNKIRQAAITKELIEIVSGAASAMS